MGGCTHPLPGARLRSFTSHEVGFKNTMTRSREGRGLWENEGSGVKQVGGWGPCQGEQT